MNFMDVTSLGATETTTASKQPVQNPADALTSKDTFLKLLVAQIRNQNPMEPQDGIQFVSQLAQFSGLEQSIEMRKELEAIHKILEPATTDAGASGSEQP